jgi:hypothetical protein
MDSELPHTEDGDEFQATFPDEVPPADIPRPFECVLPPSLLSFNSFDSTKLIMEAAARVRAAREQTDLFEPIIE